MKIHPFILIIVLGAAVSSYADWPAYPVDWTAQGTFSIDLSEFLEGPAGKHGPLRVQDGHLVTGDGSRFRIWGVNVTGAACYPEKDDAPQVADFLSRWGINCVRFHFLDSPWSDQASLFDPNQPHTQALDVGQMDRLDYFVAQLKARGIYSNFNLNVGRVYRAQDGVRDHDIIGLGKALHYFDPRIQTLHRDFARCLLTHTNPYTRRPYHREPALAIVELVNENSIVESWFVGRLRGRRTQRDSWVWTDITPSYARQLTEFYNQWLRTHLEVQELKQLVREAQVTEDVLIPRLQPDQFKQASALRFHSEARFYMQLENDYFQMMSQYLKEELGVRALLVATSDHNHYHSAYPLLASAARLDVVDGHVYWQHPKTIKDPNTGERSFVTTNTAMVNAPQDSTVVQLARSRTADKPYTVSEINHPFPHDYACEGIPILAAYALFHDWDGIFFYTLAHNDPQQWNTRRPSHFDIGVDPVKMVGLAGAGIMFHRADIRPAKSTQLRSYTAHQVIESLRLDANERFLFTPGYDPLWCLLHGVAIDSFNASGSSYGTPESSDALISDTGELVWRTANQKGLVTINTEYTQAFIGYLNQRTPALKNLQVEMETPFGAVFVTSLDGKPLRTSDRILLGTTARNALTDMKWNARRNGLEHWGRLPMCVEPVKGTVILQNLEACGPFRVRALDGNGRPLEAPVSIEQESHRTVVQVGSPASLWYVMERMK